MRVEFFIENRSFEQNISKHDNSRGLSFDAYCLGAIRVGSGEKISQGLFVVEENSEPDTIFRMYEGGYDLRFFVNTWLPANAFQALKDYDQEKYSCKITLGVYPDEGIFNKEDSCGGTISWNTKEHEYIKGDDVKISIRPREVFFMGYLREEKQTNNKENQSCGMERGLSIQKGIIVRFDDKIYAGFYFVSLKIITVVSMLYGDPVSRPAVGGGVDRIEAEKILQEILESAKSRGELK